MFTVTPCHVLQLRFNMPLIRDLILCRKIELLYSVYEYVCMNVNMNECLGMLRGIIDV